MKEIINFQNYTKLPVSHLFNSNLMGSHLEIETPTGIKIINLIEIDKGIFKQSSEINVPTQDIISQLANIENEAKDYLLKKWLKENKYNG